uniref:Recep_L_domain domain-containing protein n=1 Tax=Brugia timori TaxID=42155 RepID=A0A0R3QS66_9BILA
LCLSSTQCFQDVKNEKLSEDQNDHWLLLSGIGQSDCKSDENEWIKPTVIGYLVGQLIGAIFELNFGRDLNQDSTVVFVQFSRSINIRNVIRWCQRLSNHELHLLNSSQGLVKGDWIIEDEDENCDVVEEAPWSRYFFRGMIVGFLIGLGGGVLLGFLCWQVQVHKKNYNL